MTVTCPVADSFVEAAAREAGAAAVMSKVTKYYATIEKPVAFSNCSR